MAEPKGHAIVLAGGIGARLWPMSRRRRPKQFLQLHGEMSLLAQTIERLSGLYPPERIHLVCKPFHLEAIITAVTGIPEENIHSEPVPKGTAAAVLWASGMIGLEDPDAVISVFPSDHIIRPAELFLKTIAAGQAWALEHGEMVVYGIRPTRVETNYGYIETGGTEGRVQGLTCLEVVGFHEKPDPQSAASYLRSDRFLWNSGIFTFSHKTLKAILDTGLFPAWTPLMARLEEGAGVDQELYALLPDDPFDTAVVEKLVRFRPVRSPLDPFGLAVFPCSFEWHDMGIWESYYYLAQKDDRGNAIKGKACCLDCADSLILSDGEVLVAAMGLEGMVVVSHGDAVLVCPRKELDRIRELVAKLEEEGYDSYV